jgi:hypothetical protein
MQSGAGGRDQGRAAPTWWSVGQAAPAWILGEERAGGRSGWASCGVVSIQTHVDGERWASPGGSKHTIPRVERATRVRSKQINARSPGTPSKLHAKAILASSISGSSTRLPAAPPLRDARRPVALQKAPAKSSDEPHLEATPVMPQQHLHPALAASSPSP